MKKDKIINFFKNKYNLAFLFILALAIYIRIRYFFIESIWPDEAIYAWHGLQLSQNPLYFFSEQLAAEHPPLIPIFIALFNYVFSIEFAAKLVNPLFGILGIILIYLVGKELKNEFVGLLAAVMLSFHHLHWFFSSRILLDVPLTTMFTLTAYCLIKYEKSQSRKWLWFLGISMALTYWTKFTGILVVVFVGLYFLITNFKTWKDSKFTPTKALIKKVVFPFLIFLLFISPLLIRDFVITGTPPLYSPDSRIVQDAFNVINLFYLQQLPFLISWYIIPFAFLGLLFIFLYRKKGDWLLLSLLLTFFLFFTFVSQSRVPRYVMPALPALFIMASFAIVEILLFLKSIIKIDPKIFKWIKVGVFLIIFLIYSPIAIPILGYGPLYERGLNLQESKVWSYTGFNEAGEWIKTNAPDDAILYAGSNRAMSFYSDRAYENYGGTLRVLRMSEEEFRNQIAEETKEVYLEVDMWEWGQPDWVYPLSQEKLNNIINMGFEPVKFVERELPTQQGLVKQPIIFIFKLNKSQVFVS